MLSTVPYLPTLCSVLNKLIYVSIRIRVSRQCFASPRTPVEFARNYLDIEFSISNNYRNNHKLFLFSVCNTLDYLRRGRFAVDQAKTQNPHLVSRTQNQTNQPTPLSINQTIHRSAAQLTQISTRQTPVLRRRSENLRGAGCQPAGRQLQHSRAAGDPVSVDGDI